MDSALRTISYIADIGNIVVVMARRPMSQSSSEDLSECPVSASEGKSQYMMICYVFESEDVSSHCCSHCYSLFLSCYWVVLSLWTLGFLLPPLCGKYWSRLSERFSSTFPQAQLIAQSIGQAFSVAYREFLRANGINPTDLSQKQYSDIINSQEMYHDDLIHFSNSDNCKEV